MRILHEKREMESKIVDLCFMVRIVVIKFNELIIDEAPAKWREKIEVSTECPLWNIIFERGG
jgi:hypothetical protein